ncbi:MAG TPA: hypothetical protein VFB43_07160 [Terracidiphilus sp.]|nr:hypothetical protein [Terracidiphilus sp.]
MDTHGYISVRDAREALQQVYRNDSESNLQTALLESLSDELKPIDARGRRRPNPALVLSFLLLCALAGVFIYFSVGGHR